VRADGGWRGLLGVGRGDRRTGLVVIDGYWGFGVPVMAGRCLALRRGLRGAVRPGSLQADDEGTSRGGSRMCASV